MAGTYRTTGNNLSSKIGRVVTAKTKQKVNKGKIDYFQGQRKEMERIKTAGREKLVRTRGEEQRKTLTHKASLKGALVKSSSKAKVDTQKRISKIKESSVQRQLAIKKGATKKKKTQPKKLITNDLLYGKKIKTIKKRKKLSKERKW